MSNTRYIELDSSYRNRDMWRLPAQFEIQLSQSGNKTKFDALDPIALASPFHQFSGKFDTAGNAFITGTVSMTITPAVLGIGNTSSVETIIGKFVSGSLFQERNYYSGAVLTITNSVGVVEHQRIISYRFINNDGVNDYAKFTTSGFSSNVSNTNNFIIVNPSINNRVFIPYGENAENYYIRDILEDTTIGEYRTITGYEFDTHLAILDSAFGGGWAVTDSYNLRKAKPSETGTLVASTLTQFTLPATSSTETDYYRGDFIYIPSTGDIRRIGSYDGATKIGIVTSAFSAVPGAVAYEILSFTRDNYVPLNYTGSEVSQQEMSCYEIQLVSLVLPNRTLTVGKGSRITFYPFIYVEFTNVSAPSAGNRGIIYSNNPNSNRALFRSAVDDIPNQISSPFIKLDGNGATQTVKFKPNDTLRFTVRLPSGEIFETDMEDFYSPLTPNPLVQISAEFSIKKV